MKTHFMLIHTKAVRMDVSNGKFSSVLQAQFLIYERNEISIEK